MALGLSTMPTYLHLNYGLFKHDGSYCHVGLWGLILNNKVSYSECTVEAIFISDYFGALLPLIFQARS